eukprot:3415703-Rhodomonas_salina.2
MSGTQLACTAERPRVCYAMSGAELAYGAARGSHLCSTPRALTPFGPPVCTPLPAYAHATCYLGTDLEYAATAPRAGSSGLTQWGTSARRRRTPGGGDGVGGGGRAEASAGLRERALRV